MKIVVGASSFADSSSKAMDLLLSKGIEVEKNPYGRKMTTAEIIEHLQGADGLLAGLELLNNEVFEKTPSLKAIARIGIGMDNVDQEAARKRGIRISNTPDAPTDAVAEMALTALLSIAHEMIPANKDMHNGIWKKRIGFSLMGLNVLFIGYGRIGRKFAEYLQVLGSKIIIFDPQFPDISEENLSNAIQKADVITFHASGKDEILTPEMFSYVKEGTVILNCARGTLINEQALYEGLMSRKILYYWGDVFWKEPYDGILTKCGNAILTPHISTYNRLCRERMEMEAVNNILEDLGIV